VAADAVVDGGSVKTAACLASGWLVFALVAGAEPTATTMSADQIAQRMTERLNAEVTLTPEQVEPVAKIHRTTADRLCDMSPRCNPSAKKGTLQQAAGLFRQQQEQLKGILTPEQWSAFESHRAERSAEAQTRIQTARLGLSEAQVVQVEPINLDAARNLQRVVANAKNADRRQRRAALKEARSVQATREQALEKILTADQWKLYQKDKEAMRAMLRERIEE
jgi:hypothetical protein